MSDTTLDEAAMQAEFDRLAGEKGDRLAELLGHVEDTETTDEGTQTGQPSPEPAAQAAGTTEPVTTSQAQPAPAAAAKPAAAATDIWANAPAELRDAHQRALAAADQRYRSDVGRQAAHQRRIQILEQENAELRKRGPAPAASDGSTAAPTTEQPKPATTSLREDPAIKKSLEDYPEVVGPILQVTDALEARLGEIARDVTLTREERAAQTQQAQEAALNAAHPDWREACGSQQFADWLNTQPKAIKDIVARNGENIVDAEEAISMVGNFKAHLALTQPPPPPPPPPPARQQQNGGAPQPTSLEARRAAQLHAVNGGTPKGGQPAVTTDGPATGSDEAMFNHFVAKKQANRR